jgi:hypothetical protein
MAFIAVCFVLYVKGSLAIMAGPAKFSLRDLAHVHLVRTFLHLKNVIVTGAALFTLVVHVRFMTEVNRFGVFGIECQITTAYHGKSRTQREHKIQDRQQHTCHLHRFSPPFFAAAQVQEQCSLTDSRCN